MKIKDRENIPEVNSIRKTEYYCKLHGKGLSRRQITKLVADNRVAHFKVGNKVMVNWASLMSYITTGDTTNTNTYRDDDDFLSRRRSICK